MSQGACRLNKRTLALLAGLCASLNITACSPAKPVASGAGLTERVFAAQGVNAVTTFGGLVTINGQFDTLTAVPKVSPPSSPNLLAITPSRNLVAAFDASTNTVYAVDTSTKEPTVGSVRLQGPTISMVMPTTFPVGYAAVPTATVPGFSFVGAVDVMNFSTNSILTIAVPSAEMVVSNTTGSQVLAFSNGSDAITVLSPSAAAPPVDTSCIIPSSSPACVIVSDPRLSRPVNAVINGSTAYIMNCGFECGGSQQASVAVFDMTSLTVTATVQVNGATDALLNGTTLYVIGTGTPTGQTCSSLTNSINPKTAATYCGTLDIIDLTTLTDPYFNNPGGEIAIPDGYHHRIDFTQDGQLFVGSYGCTNVGNVNDPVGEVRGCLAIYNTVKNVLVIPPDNGDVGGFQGFTSRYREYVAEGGNLRVYDTTKDILFINSQYLPTGSIDVIGYVGDVKAIDFF